MKGREIIKKLNPLTTLIYAKKICTNDQVDKTEKETRQVGVEPTAFCLGNRRSIH